MKRAGRILAGCCLLSLVGGAGIASAQTYKAIGQYHLPGVGAHAVAVDSDSRRIFVATSDGVVVLNADTGASLGQLSGLKDARDIFLVPEQNGEEAAPSTKAFATDGAGNVVEFSLADMKPTAKIKLATGGASSLCYDSEAKTIEAVSVEGSLTSIDPADGKVVRSHKLPTGSGQIVCGTLHHVYVADTAASVIHVLNDDTMKNDGDLPVMNGRQPSGLALDTKGRRLFVGCENGIIDVIDTDAGFTFIELKGGNGPAHELFTWLPQGKGQWKAAAFIAQQDGTLSGVRMNAFINYTLGGTYKLAPGLGAIAYDEKSHHLFIATMDGAAPALSVVGY